MDELVEKLGLSRCPKLLSLALTHPSAVGKGVARLQGSNQRLEFVGDALLGGIVALHLFRQYPHLNEGELTLCKISIVRKESLAAAAKRLELGKYLILGMHEEAAGGRERDSILADALEAVIVDPQYRYEMARSAWNKAKKTYSLNRVISELKSIYQNYGKPAEPDAAE